MRPRSIAALGLLLLQIPAHADFDRAAKDYAAGGLPQAHQEFLQEAELGNAATMLNVGVMYWDMLDRLPNWNWQDPMIHEIRAAAHARGGDFDRALDAQDLAIRRASALHWDLAPLQARRAAYAARQAWSRPIDY